MVFAETDEQLFERYRNGGDQGAFAVLFERYRRPLVAYLRRFFDFARAEDVLQETMLQVHRRADTFTPEKSFRPWMYTIALHRAIDELRKQKRQSPIASLSAHARGLPGSDNEPDAFSELLKSDETQPLEALILQENIGGLHKAIARLPAYLKAVVMLAYFQHRTYREIADILDIPMGTMKSRLHEALNRLARFMGAPHRVQSREMCKKKSLPKIPAVARIEGQTESSVREIIGVDSMELTTDAYIGAGV